jgi:hypothetical protein
MGWRREVAVAAGSGIICSQIGVEILMMHDPSALSCSADARRCRAAGAPRAHGALVLLAAAMIGVLVAAPASADQASIPAAEAGTIELAAARAAFTEAEQACRSPEGALWRFSLCVPMLLVDRTSRDVVANQADPAGELHEVDGVWVGSWPAEMNIANTAVDWGGVRWTMIMWPLPEEQHARVELMMHEAFHNVQATIGFPAVSPDNSHLATRDGRLWLRMEWRALQRALACDGGRREAAIYEALTFRAYRRSLFPKAADEERALEMHEGLAAFTGLHLSGLDLEGQRRVLRERLDEAEASPSLVRSFAYWSGPAYALLLEEIKAGWRKRLTPAHDLGWMLQDRLGLQLPDDLEAAARADMRCYDGEAVLAAETAREKEWQERVSRFEAQLVDGTVLVLPFSQVSLQLEPASLVPLGEAGTVYPTLRVVDRWGILSARTAALVAADWSAVRVAVTDPEGLASLGEATDRSRKLAASGWTLELSPGWKVVAGERTGDWAVVAAE